MPVKFPRQIIVNIRRQYAIGHTIKELSDAYDFNEKTIRGIVHGQTYKNVVISPHDLSRPVPNLPRTQSQRERQQSVIGRRAKGQPPEKIFVCPLCRLNRGYADEVFKHIGEKHGQQHACPACKNFRSYADRVLAHMNREHPRLSKRCPTCFKEGVLVSGPHDEVLAHMREKHPETTSAVQDRTEEATTDVRRQPPTSLTSRRKQNAYGLYVDVYQCVVGCGFENESRSVVIDHIRTKHPTEALTAQGEIEEESPLGQAHKSP